MGRSRLGRRLVDESLDPRIVLGAILLIEAATGLGLAWWAGWDRIADGIKLTTGVWLALCVGGQLLAYLGYAIGFREVVGAAGGPRLSLRASGGIVAVGFTPVFSASMLGGFSVDRVALEEMRLDRQEVTARLVALNVLEYLVLAPLACVAGLLAFLGIGGHAPASISLPWLAVVPGVAVAWWLTQQPRRRRLLDARGKGFLRRGLAHGVAGVSLLRVRPLNPGLGFAGIGLYWAGDMLSLWAALRLFDVHVGPAALILAYATGYALTRRALPAGGPGAVEVLLPLALAWVGVPFWQAVVAALTYRFFNFWLALVPGLVVLARMRRLDRALPRTGSHGPVPKART